MYVVFLLLQNATKQGKYPMRTSTILTFNTAFREKVADRMRVGALDARRAFYTIVVLHITDWVGL